MNTGLVLGAVAGLLLATIILGAYGLRISRTTSDFYVASRSVRPVWNASAISGEYLSAGTFLGLAGLVLLSGSEGFWFPIGYAAGYLLVLLFVGAPLRRSGAYTIPDFIQARTQSRAARHVTSVVVLVIGWLYIVPQMHGAALTLQVVAGLPLWVGAVLVAIVVGGVVAAGGMRAVTAVQAFQYWLKLTALAVPVAFLCIALSDHAATIDPHLIFPVERGPGGADLYGTLSLMLALLLGTIGLPHVLVRFYTSPDGPSARRATVMVIVLVGAFYAVSSTMGLIARIAAPDLAKPGLADTVVLELPSRVIGGVWGDVLTALIVAGAFAAFLATSSGLIVSLAGVVSQDLFTGSVRSFRLAAVICALVPLGFSFLTVPEGLVSSVGQVFVFAASSLTPVMLLGVWWPRMTAKGAIVGMVVGALACGAAMIGTALNLNSAWLAAVLAQPAAWTIPLTTATVFVVSLLDKNGAPAGTPQFLARLHLPESHAR
ncbi:cation acetate symporter [Microbacterium sp. NC79]|uniref:sodium/solute symporter n=1 Tax=Microbacterium sp. NC79 TaxID=2851009 RepID=UPI001C2BC236|nr:cation acetate symporter [Microbacterium sp. NC79]MBV0893786.1 cation acetate symporter [Microbacterium sp. NC79]